VGTSSWEASVYIGSASGLRLLISAALGEAEILLTTKLLVIRLFAIAKEPQLRSKTELLFLDSLVGSDLYQ
jgi:hypothetical protein